MEIKIIAVGKIKSRELNYLIDDYLKRISRKFPISCIEVPEQSGKFKNSLEVIKRETQSIKSKISPNEAYIALSPDGKMYDSLNFADWMKNGLETQPGKITFCIGGSYGLSNEFITNAKAAISFSKMTFPHQVFRLILTEQIYRATTIIYNEKYHK